MDTSALFNSILTSLWVITTGLAIMLRASAKAQRRALKRLRDKDIAWSIYTHTLRSDYARDTGKSPLDYPDVLSHDDYDEVMF
jgi:hypothetical protein